MPRVRDKCLKWLTGRSFLGGRGGAHTGPSYRAPASLKLLKATRSTAGRLDAQRPPGSELLGRSVAAQKPEKLAMEPDRWAVTPPRQASVPCADRRPCHPFPPPFSQGSGLPVPAPGNAWAEPTLWLYSPRPVSAGAAKSFSCPGSAQGQRQGIRS